MCYDISFTVNLKEIGEYFPELVHTDQLEITFTGNAHIPGHAYGDHPIIYRQKDEKDPRLMLMQWGIIPHYITDEKSFARHRASMLNIRSERILADRESYWYKIRHKRCLVPVTGFFEHRGIDGWKKKVPYYITLKGQKTFFIPGLYAAANLVDKETGEMHQQYSFAAITREANSDMRLIHNCGDSAGRMPLMLPFELSQAWLNEALSQNEYREILSYEMPPEEMSYRTVYTIRTAKERPESAEKTAEYNWPNLPPLRVV